MRLNVAITSYLLSVAVFVPVSGWAADRYGARRVFVAAIGLFTLSSVACALARTCRSWSWRASCKAWPGP